MAAWIAKYPAQLQRKSGKLTDLNMLGATRRYYKYFIRKTGIFGPGRATPANQLVWRGQSQDPRVAEFQTTLGDLSPHHGGNRTITGNCTLATGHANILHDTHNVTINVRTKVAYEMDALKDAYHIIRNSWAC